MKKTVFYEAFIILSFIQRVVSHSMLKTCYGSI